MRKTPGRWRKRLFTMTALLSLLLCIMAVVYWNASWEKQSHRRWDVGRRKVIGHVEFVNQSNRLTIRDFSTDQLLYQQWFADQAQQLDQFDREEVWSKARLKVFVPNSAGYRQLVQQLEDHRRWRDANANHLLAEPIADYALVIPLPHAAALLAILPLIWIARWWWRNHDDVRSLALRYFRWEPASDLMRTERVRRTIFAGIAAGSLFLTWATLFLWGRSYLASDHYSSVEFASGNPGSQSRMIQRSTVRGGFGLAEMRIPATAGSGPALTSVPADYRVWQELGRIEPPRMHKLPPAPVPGKAVNSYGFHYQRFPLHGYMLVMPFWFFACCFAVMPITWLLMHRRRAVRVGHCPACDYDLTGNSSGVCPECGRPVLDVTDDRRQTAPSTI